MCNVWVIELYVIIRVEMKPVYWELKVNQGIVVIYVSICFSMMELMCYAWWLIYRLVCNHYGWNETNVLGVERKPRYHGYIQLYASVWLNWWGMCDDWVILSYVIILVEMKPVYWGLKANQCTMVIHAPISFRMVEMIWLLLWLNDESICNHFDWNEIKVFGIERKSRYGDWKWIIMKVCDWC